MAIKNHHYRGGSAWCLALFSRALISESQMEVGNFQEFKSKAKIVLLGINNNGLFYSKEYEMN